MPDYLWRAAVLAAVILIAQRVVLRSREYDADLRADQAAGYRRHHRRWPHRGLPRHAHLADPRQRALLGLSRRNTRRSDIHVISAVLVAPLVGATIGLGLWRGSLVSRVTGTWARVTPVALGVFVGSLLGQAASFASIALPIGGFDQPLLIFVVACGATGATVVVAGFGEVWADLSGRFSRPAGNWLPAVVLSAALFSVVFWASAQLRTVLEFGSWSLISAGVWAVLATPTVGVLATALAVAAGWALWAGNASGRVPAWLLGPGADLCWSRPAPRPGKPSWQGSPAARPGQG